MGIQDYILFIVLFAVMIFIVVYLVVNRKKASKCGNGCSGCPYAENCKRKK